MSGLPRGVRLGVDVGDVRVGLARSDLDGLIATPIETLERDTAARRVVEEVVELEARAIMVGLPRSLDGTQGAAAEKARSFAAELVTLLAAASRETEVRLIDERLTTVSAHKALHSSGRKGRRHRQVVDQVAAVMILQQALDVERSTGRRGGELVEPGPDADAADATPSSPTPQDRTEEDTR
jgi:putative Holliday junction resolvase